MRVRACVRARVCVCARACVRVCRAEMAARRNVSGEVRETRAHTEAMFERGNSQVEQCGQI